MKLIKPIPAEKRAELESYKSQTNQLIRSYHEEKKKLDDLQKDFQDSQDLVISLRKKIDLAEPEPTQLARAERVIRLVPALIKEASDRVKAVENKIGKLTRWTTDLVLEIAQPDLYQQLLKEFMEVAGHFYQDDLSAGVQVSQTWALRQLINSLKYPERSGNEIEVNLKRIDALLEGGEVLNPYSRPAIKR